MERMIHQHLYGGMGDTFGARSEVAMCFSLLLSHPVSRVSQGGWGADFRRRSSLRNAGRDVKPDLHCLLTLQPPRTATSPQTPTAIRSHALWLRLKHTPRGLQGNSIWAWLIFKKTDRRGKTSVFIFVWYRSLLKNQVIDFAHYMRADLSQIKYVSTKG